MKQTHAATQPSQSSNLGYSGHHFANEQFTHNEVEDLESMDPPFNLLEANFADYGQPLHQPAKHSTQDHSPRRGAHPVASRPNNAVLMDASDARTLHLAEGSKEGYSSVSKPGTLPTSSQQLRQP